MKIDQNKLANIVQERKTKVDKIVREVITSCLILDLPFQDQYYIEERTREVLHEAMKLVEFHSKEIAELRKALLRKNLQELVKKLPAQKKFKKVKDLTDERNARCEPLVYEVIQKLLNVDMLVSEPELMDQIFDEQQSHSAFLQLFGFVDSFFKLLELSTEASYDVALKEKWNGKYKEQITFKDIDRVLKNMKQD